MTLSRNKEQEIAMEAIYTALTYLHMKVDFQVQDILSDLTDIPFEELDLYLKEVVVKALSHRKEIIDIVSPHLNNWTFERLNRCAQSILLLSVAHGKFVGGTEKPIIIDTAVRLAKKYLDDGDYKFINAVLDQIL